MFPYDSNGVDVTLIRWMLSMTPAERLATLQDFVDFVWLDVVHSTAPGNRVSARRHCGGTPPIGVR